MLLTYFYFLILETSQYVEEEYIIEETAGKIYLPVNFDSDGIKILEIDDESVKIWDDKIKILRTDTNTPTIQEHQVDMTSDISAQLTITETSGATIAPLAVFTQQSVTHLITEETGHTEVICTGTRVNSDEMMESEMKIKIINKEGQKVRRIPAHMQPRINHTERHNCPNCNSSYSQRKNLQRHLKLECGQEPKFACPFCTLRCKRNNQMQHHIATKHRVSLRFEG